MSGICKQKMSWRDPLFSSVRPAEGANTVCMNEIRPCCWFLFFFFVLWLHLHDYSNLTMWVIWLCLHVFSEREDNKLRSSQQMLNREELCSVVRNDAVIMWDFRPHNMFCYHFNSLNVFSPDRLRSSPSSTGCALSRWKKKNSSSKDKQQSPWLIVLRRRESKPYCWHQEASDVMVMSMALIVNRRQRHTHARAASQSACGSVSAREEKTAKGGDGQFWKSGQQIEDGCDRGGDRTRYVRFHLFVSCRSEKNKALFSKQLLDCG